MSDSDKSRLDDDQLREDIINSWEFYFNHNPYERDGLNCESCKHQRIKAFKL